LIGEIAMWYYIFKLTIKEQVILIYVMCFTIVIVLSFEIYKYIMSKPEWRKKLGLGDPQDRRNK